MIVVLIMIVDNSSITSSKFNRFLNNSLMFLNLIFLNKKKLKHFTQEKHNSKRKKTKKYFHFKNLIINISV